MFSHPMLFRVQTDAHRRTLIRAAERHRLAAIARAGYSPRLYRLLMAGVGRALVSVGTELQARAGNGSQSAPTVQFALDKQTR